MAYTDTPLPTQSGQRLEAGSCEQRAVAVVVTVAGERVRDAAEMADEKPEEDNAQGKNPIPEGTSGSGKTKYDTV